MALVLLVVEDLLVEVLLVVEDLLFVVLLVVVWLAVILLVVEDLLVAVLLVVEDLLIAVLLVVVVLLVAAVLVEVGVVYHELNDWRIFNQDCRRRQNAVQIYIYILYDCNRVLGRRGSDFKPSGKLSRSSRLRVRIRKQNHF